MTTQHLSVEQLRTLAFHGNTDQARRRAIEELARRAEATDDLLAAAKRALELLDRQREEAAAAAPVPGLLVTEGPIAVALRAAIAKAEK